MVKKEIIVITLYELHWSHYCEKVRWALDFKKLDWKKININAFTKEEMKNFPKTDQRHLVPLIHDSRTEKIIGDSSPILRYLEEAYPNSPRLFPVDPTEKEAMYKLLIELDSKLAVISRKLGYTQIILENPGILSQLFLSTICKGLFTLPGVRRISGAFLAMLLIKRFRFELNESRYLYEELEKYLLTIVEKLSRKKFLMNDRFSAADLTLAVYLRPLLIVPFFRDHPKLAKLFEWQKIIFREHNREEQLLYQVLIEKNRKRYLPVRRKIRTLKSSDFIKKIETAIEQNERAFNDHETIWTKRMWLIPYYYFFRMKANKVRQQHASKNIR